MKTYKIAYRYVHYEEAEVQANSLEEAEEIVFNTTHCDFDCVDVPVHFEVDKQKTKELNKS